MNKTKLVSATVFCVLAVLSTVNAQTTSPTPVPESPNPLGTAFGAVAIIILFAFIAYAGYKVVKKWSRASSD